MEPFLSANVRTASVCLQDLSFKSLPLSGLTEVPAGVPEDVVHIDLSNNSITHLKAKDFLDTKSLRILNISHNNMQHADTGTCTVVVDKESEERRDRLSQAASSSVSGLLIPSAPMFDPAISKISRLCFSVSQVLFQDFCTFKTWICPTTTCILSSMEFWRISISCLKSGSEGTPGSVTTGDFCCSHSHCHLEPRVTIYPPSPSQYPLHGVLAASAPRSEAQRPDLSLPSGAGRGERGGVRKRLQQRVSQRQAARPSQARPKRVGSAGRSGGGARAAAAAAAGAAAETFESVEEVRHHQAVLSQANAAPQFWIIKPVCIRWRKYFWMCCFHCTRDIKTSLCDLLLRCFNKRTVCVESWIDVGDTYRCTGSWATPARCSHAC